MIESNSLKSLAGQIANAFCKDTTGNKILCLSTVQTRLINLNSDASFEYLLSTLNSKKMYAFRILNIQSESLSTVKITVEGTDIVTGAIHTGSINGVARTRLNDFAYIFSKVDQNYIATVNNLNNNYYVCSKTVPGGYGLSIVPSSIPNKEPVIVPTPILPTPGGSPAPTGSKGVDPILETLLDPVVLITLAVGGYLLYKGFE